VNHSCAPNTVLTFDGSTAVMRAAVAVAVGDELNIGYVEVGEPVHMSPHMAGGVRLVKGWALRHSKALEMRTL
jgi:hypothetical protein